MKSNGGEILYECKDTECGGYLGGNTVITSMSDSNETLMIALFPAERVTARKDSNAFCAPTSQKFAEQRYTVGKLVKEGSEATVAVLSYTVSEPEMFGCDAFKGRTFAMVLVMENKPREQHMVSVKAEDMQSAIANTGRVTLYGIYFDTDKTDVKPESAPTLEQISKLLKDNPQLKLLVVGHTDNVGEFAYNINLSTRRAESVVQALKTHYGIEAGRLRGYGVGMVAPAAANDTEEGRAKNRRVELVKI